MGFNIKQKINFEWPVKLKVPGLKSYVEKEVVFKFKYLKQSEVEAATELSYEKFCLENVVGWSGVTDETDKEIEFNEDNLKALLDFAGFGQQIFQTYLRILAGVAEKN